MGKYQNGLETQEKILAACRELFYEKGYDKTTFADISKMTGINQSAIHYHFKSKENLLQLIYSATVKKNNELVEFYSDRSTSALAKFFFGGQLYLYKAYHDAEYRRFFIDAARLLRTNADSFVNEQADILDFLKSKKGTDDEDKHFDLMIVAAVDQMMLLYMDNNMENLDLMALEKRVKKTYKKLMEVSDEEYQKAVAQQQLLEERCKWDEVDTSLG